jgi:glycosyltransferase involved in cell wall biosynthesis
MAAGDDEGFQKWDIVLTHPVRSRVLRNVLRTRRLHPLLQLNPGVVLSLFKGRFDFVFLAGYVSPSNWIVAGLARLLGVRVIYQSDTNVLNEKRRRHFLLAAARRLFFSGIWRFLAVGDMNREFYLAAGVAPGRICFCPYPIGNAYLEMSREGTIERRQAVRRRMGIDEGKTVFVVCGKLIPRKRVQDAILACARAAHAEIGCLVVGSGVMGGELRELAHGSENVWFAGFVNQSAIADYYAAADVGVVCSDYDAHPLVCAEMAASGLPLIVSDRCGVYGPNDVLRPGENGAVYPCGDVEELARHMLVLHDDRGLRERYSSRSREIAQTQTVRAATAAFLGVIETLATGSVVRSGIGEAGTSL